MIYFIFAGIIILFAGIILTKYVFDNSFYNRNSEYSGKSSLYERLKESRRVYRVFFEKLKDMVIIYRYDDGVIEEVNPVTEVITGFSQEELTKKTFKEFFHPSYRHGISGCDEDLALNGAGHTDAVIVCKDGTYREVVTTLNVAEFDKAKIVIAVIKDISEEVRNFEEQKLREKELGDFWRSSIKREERIKYLRVELEKAKQQINDKKEGK